MFAAFLYTVQIAVEYSFALITAGYDIIRFYDKNKKGGTLTSR